MPIRSGLPRRRLLGAGIAAALVAGGPARAQSPAVVVVVSRERLLREAAAPRRLHEAEARMTRLLQDRIDQTKAALAAEEEELTQLRGELPAAEFEERVAAFDQRVRMARGGAQERAAALQRGFQDARARIAAALPALMERLRVEAGASLVLDADQALAVDPAIDLTDRAIALFDAEGPSPPVPGIDLSGPLFRPADEPSDGGAPEETPPPGSAP